MTSSCSLMQPSSDSDDAPNANTTDWRQCLVRGCSTSAEHMLIGHDPIYGTENWPVCRDHFVKMTVRAQAWETARGGTGSYRRWLLMGDDLPKQA